MNIQAYISSGIIEAYVSGLITADEQLELERLRVIYPELDKQIIEVEMQMEEYALIHSVQPSEKVKSVFMDIIHDSAPKHQEVKPIDNKITVLFGWKILLISFLVGIALSLIAILLFYRQVIK